MLHTMSETAGKVAGPKATTRPAHQYDALLNELRDRAYAKWLAAGRLAGDCRRF